MKRIIFLLTLPLLLGACTPTQSGKKTENGSQNTNSNTGTGGNTETGGNTGEEIIINYEEEHQENDAINLDEKRTWYFHEGKKPCWPEDWEFYYDTTHNPTSSCFWENSKTDDSGIKFYDKKQYLISPNFVSYPKVEVNMKFWFSAKDDKQATQNQPTFLVEEFDSNNNRINIDTINFERSDVPNNNTALSRRLYIRQSQMTSFILRFNNFVPNGGSGYMPILCEISLKGWQYE